MCETVVVASVFTNCLFTIYYISIIAANRCHSNEFIHFSLLGYSYSLLRQKSIEGADTTGRTSGPGRARQGRAQL
jgi:hypothetical protein